MQAQSRLSKMYVLPSPHELSVCILFIAESPTMPCRVFRTMLDECLKKSLLNPLGWIEDIKESCGGQRNKRKWVGRQEGTFPLLL